MNQFSGHGREPCSGDAGLDVMVDHGEDLAQVDRGHGLIGGHQEMQEVVVELGVKLANLWPPV